MIAEVTAHEIGRLDLHEALELTALIALHDFPRGERYALRWFSRWLAEADSPSVAEIAVVATALAGLGTSGHVAALAVLRAAHSNR